MRVTAVLESRSDTATRLSLVRRLGRQPRTRDGSSIAVGSGLLTFDGNGNYVTASNTFGRSRPIGFAQRFAA